MAVDPYAPCPCGSGKKLKFCCSDLFGEIEKVHRMLEGDQPRAALRHLEKTLAKTPGRASLLDIKATIEQSLGDHEAARATVEEYVRVDPTNPSAHAQAALLAANSAADDEATDEQSREASRRAADSLQTALELVDETIPARVLQAVGAVGQALLAAGNLVAARSHLWLYQGIAGDEDTRAMELLMRLGRVSGLPLVLRDNLYLREAPAGHAAEAAHDEAQLLASRGQWRRAAAELDRLRLEHPDLPILHYNAALVHGWLGEQQQLVEGLRTYAKLLAEAAPGDSLPDDAIEAEAIAQLLDEEHREAPVEVMQLAWSVADEERLLDRLTRDKRVVPHQLSESELVGHDGPPPRLVTLLLDRPLPETGAGIDAEATPRIAGILSYYGRQTDRAERLQLIADRDDHYDQTLALVAEIAGDALAAQADEQSVGRSAAEEGAMRQRWRFPDDTPVADRRRVVAEAQRTALLDEWTAKPKAALNNTPPADAAKSPALRLPLAAALLVLEQTASGSVDEATLDEVRAKVGMPKPERIDPRSIDPETLPLSRINRIDLRGASDDTVFTLYRRAELCGAADAAVATAREAIRRDPAEHELTKPELYARLVALEPDPADALDWLGGARADEGAEHENCSTWDLAELELRVMEGQYEEANRLVHHLRDEHLDEPGVAERLYSMLYSMGVVPAPGEAPAGPAPAAPAETAAAGGSRLWTPDAGAPDAGPAGGGQKIWTPS
ncbi:hypothetical protein [Botrimarina sp.]|uniref:YecA family protein n=1 Tax=Botrimarina sp. TaxID=2795802 RepID=UPI0032EAFD5C